MTTSQEIEPTGRVCRRCGSRNVAGAGRCWSCGGFLALNRESRTHGAYSTQLDAALEADVLRTLRSRGFDDDDPVARPAAAGLHQAAAMMHSFFRYLAESDGPISPKGRTRRAVEGWSRAADRVAKFAAMLGLEKRPKPIRQSPEEWLDSLGTRTPETEKEGDADESEATQASDDDRR